MLTFLSEEQENKLEGNLIWLFGSPRSGTSWLGLELLSHNTSSINETHFTDHFGAPANTTKDKAIRIIDFRKEHENYFFNQKYSDVWQFFTRKLILNRIYAQLDNLSNKIIIKDPEGGPGASDFVSSCLPNSKFIILVRDGRDIIDSIRDARQGSFMTKEGEVNNLSSSEMSGFIQNRSKMWNSLIDSLMNTYNNHNKNLRIFVKYEDLRKNTYEELKKIYEFLNINISEEELQNIVKKYTFENLPDEIKGSGKFHRSATPGKWKENFNEEEKKLMNDIMGNALKKLGYE